MGNQILDSMVPMYTAHGGVILLVVVLPLFAFFLLDGVVALARGRGVKPLLIAIGIVVGVVTVGTAMWQGGLSQLEGNPAYAVTSAGAEGNFRMLVGWAAALGAIAFLVRMAKLAFGRRS